MAESPGSATWSLEFPLLQRPFQEKALKPCQWDYIRIDTWTFSWITKKGHLNKKGHFPLLFGFFILRRCEAGAAAAILWSHGSSKCSQNMKEKKKKAWPTWATEKLAITPNIWASKSKCAWIKTLQNSQLFEMCASLWRGGHKLLLEPLEKGFPGRVDKLAKGYIWHHIIWGSCAWFLYSEKAKLVKE